jgi:hypothetical protein
MNDQGDTHPSLFDLWKKHQFRVAEIAAMTELPEEDLQAMVCGIAVKRDVAEKVLAQVSRLIHRECTLETMRVPIAEERSENKSEVARLLAEIDTERESARQGLQGLAQGTAQHAFMTKRLENIAQHLDGLSKVASPETMMEIMKQLGGKDTQ